MKYEFFDELLALIDWAQGQLARAYMWALRKRNLAQVPKEHP